MLWKSITEIDIALVHLEVGTKLIEEFKTVTDESDGVEKYV